MDDLLNKITNDFKEEDVETIASADDLTILIKANFRQGIEDQGQKVLGLLKDWYTLNKLQLHLKSFSI